MTKWLYIFEPKTEQEDFYISRTFYNPVKANNLYIIGEKKDRIWFGCYDIMNNKWVFQKYLSSKEYTSYHTFKTKDSLFVVVSTQSGKTRLIKISEGKKDWEMICQENITCGTTDSTTNTTILAGNDSNGKVVILSINQYGKVIDKKSLNKNIWVRSIFKIPKPKEEYILVGNKEDKIWVITTDGELNIQSEETIGGGNHMYEARDVIRILPTYDLVIVGRMWERKEQYGCCIKPLPGMGVVLKTNWQGKIIWEKKIRQASAFTKVIEYDWGYITVGWKEVSYDEVYPVALKVNPYGEITFMRMYDINGYANNIETLNQGYLIAGNMEVDYYIEEWDEVYTIKVKRPFLLKVNWKGEALTHTPEKERYCD